MAQEEAIMQGQEEIWKLMLAFVDSMALRCAVELGIADIINNHGCPITLAQIVDGINSPFPDINCLSRIMRLLVRKHLFTAQTPIEGGDTVYGLSNSAKWLLRDTEFSLAPMVEAETHQWLMSPWYYLSNCVKEGGIAFAKAHGSEIWEFGSKQPEFNKLFNSAMACTSNIIVQAILSSYKDGFDDVVSLLDVGGGTGMLIREIVKAHPHVHGTNFDLPHVVATAPECTGVVHVGGDMFVEIPEADAIIMKWVLHDWSDEDCVKILKNCHKALANKGRKVIFVEIVLEPEGASTFDETRMSFDLLMIAHSSGGKERTETEWKKLLKEGGFPHCNIIRIPSLPSIIEAFPA